jgi:Ca-activated chloride channel family protein
LREASMLPRDIAFGSPWFLLGLIPVAGAAAYLVWRRKAQREPALKFSSRQLVDDLPRTPWAHLYFLPDVLRIMALVLIVLALARPQRLGSPEESAAEGIDIVLALDTSCSMRAADFQPNDRIFVAKKSIGEFVKQRTNDRIGLVVFAGEAASWVPLTLDYSLVAQLLEEVDTSMLPDGTAIGSAIGVALNRLRESDAQSKVIVLLTDGDNNAGSISPKEAAEMAKSLGVRVYTILIGRGGAVPFPAGKDLFGRVVYREQYVATNPQLLKDIADITGASAYLATDKDELDKNLSDVLDKLDKSRLEAATYTAPKDELFPYLVWAAIALLFIELILGSTRLRRYP